MRLPVPHLAWTVVAASVIASGLGSSSPARAVSLHVDWESGDAWVRDLVRPFPLDSEDTLCARLPGSDPEIGVHFSEIEGGRTAEWPNHEGDPAHRGASATVEAGAVVAVGSRGIVSFRLRPRAILSGDGAHVSWLEALATVRFGPGALDVGRTRLWLGPGLHGSLLLSTNAHPLDLVHLRVAGPVALRIPFFPDLRRLSGGGALSILSDEDRDFPNPNLGILRVGSRWGTWLAVDLYRTILFAGEGRNFRWSFENVADLLFAAGENSADAEENLSDQLGAIAVVARLDALWAESEGDAEGEGDAGESGDGLWFYYEYAGEDNLKRVFVGSPGAMIGLRWARRGWELIGEVVDNERSASLWYSHTVYTSGYTYRGAVLGHHMGGDAREIIGSAAVPLPGERRLKLFAGREEALFDSRTTPAKLWTVAASGEGIVRRGRAALALDYVARWGDAYPTEELGPFERTRVSVRVTLRPGVGE